MRNYNQTISSLVRIAQQLDEAGLYEQSDLVHESLLRIAQQVVKTKEVPKRLRQHWMQGQNPISDFMGRIFSMPEQNPIRDREIMEDRSNLAIDQFLKRFVEYEEIPSEFLEYFLKSNIFRNALIRRKSGRDHTTYDMDDILRASSDKIYEYLRKKSNNFKNTNKISDILSSLEKMEDNGITIPRILRDIVIDVNTFSPANIARQEQEDSNNFNYFLQTATDEQLDNFLKNQFRYRSLDKRYDKAQEEKARRELNRPSKITTPKTREDLSAIIELSELEAKLGLPDQNPNASQYPKAPETSPVPQQQTIGGQSGKGPSSVSRTIKKPTKSSQPKVQRVRFRSPGAGSSVTTLEEFFRLVQLKPDRWEQFNNSNKDPKLKLDEIKKLIKAIGAKMGKGSVALSDVIKNIDFSDPRWQLIEPAIEIAFNEFGKYLENPSSYSSNLKPNIDEIKKFFSPILAWQELIKEELKTKSPKDLLKYFTNNNPSVSIQGPTSPGLTKGINAGPLFEIGNINYRFNDLSNKEKEDIIYMIKNGGNLPKSQSEIENEQREQMRKLQEKYPVSGQGDLRLQQQLQRNMMQ